MNATSEPQAPTVQPQPPPPRRSLVGRLFRGALLVVLIVLLSAFGVLAWVVGTESGLRWAAGIGQGFAPDQFRIERIEGRLIDAVDLAGVQIDAPAARVGVERFRLRWRAADLLTGRLSITELRLGGVRVASKEKTDEPPQQAPGPVDLPEVVLPLELDLESAVLESLQVTDPAGQPLFALDRLELSAAWQQSRVTLRRLALQLPDPHLDAELQGQVLLAAAYPLDATFSWRLLPSPDASLEGAGSVQGDITDLLFRQGLRGAAEAELKGRVRDLLGKLSWEADLRVIRVDLPAFSSDLPATGLTANLTAEGSLDEAQVKGELTAESVDLPEYGRLRSDLDLGWSDSVLQVRTLRLEERDSKARLSATGHVDLAHGLGPFELAADWDGLGWPLAGERLVASKQGKLHIEGSLDRFGYELQGRVEGPDIPPGDLQAEGTADLSGTEIARLRLDALEGRVEGKARVSWSPHLVWDAELEAMDFNPGSRWVDWPGRLGGRVSSAGDMETDRLRLSATVDALRGVLRGYPVEARGRVAMHGQDVEIPELFLQSGPSRAEVKGAIGEKLAVQFSLESPDLKTLLPDLSGALSAEGKVGGRLAAPEVSARLQANAVAFGENRLDKANGTVELGMGREGDVRIVLDAAGVQVGGLSWTVAKLRGDGTLGAHKVSAELEGEPLAVSTRLIGGLTKDDAYKGVLQDLTLRTQEFGEWGLAGSAPFSAAGAKVKAGPLCLRETQRGSGGCLSFAQQAAGQWRANLDWERLALALAQPYLPTGMHIDGDLIAAADLEASGASLKGNARIRVPHGGIRVELGEQPQVLDFTDAELSVTAAPSGLKANLDLPLRGLGGVEGALALDGWNLAEPARPSQPVDGRLQARIEDLAPLAALAPDVANLKGRIEADLRLTGTLQRPGMDGQARLDGGAVDIPALGLKLREIALAAKSQDLGRFDYEGGLKSGSGTLTLSGGSWLKGTEGWVTDVRLKGDRLTAVKTSQYSVLVSPDLKLETAEQLLNLSGEIFIPEALIQPRSLPEGTVTPSSDVVLKRDLDGNARRGPKITSDIRVRLGEDVQIDGFGLRGKVTGDLRAYVEPGKRPFGDGQLAVEDGTYRIQGIRGLASAGELKIEQGRIIYAKTPLDDPGILVIANREAGQVTASLRVSGTLRNPKMTFFSDSDPAMSQAEVLNYLLTGGGSLGAGGNGKGSQVVEMGTYLTPELYMQYESGLADKSGKVKMRYDLTEKVQIQTESGDSQGVDFFYTFER